MAPPAGQSRAPSRAPSHGPSRAPSHGPSRGNSIETKTKFSDVNQEVPPPPPPEQVYPCGCAYPGEHAPDCMWSLWEQMRDNYNQTKELMGKFMSQVNTIQTPGGAGASTCKCPSSCHGQDLASAVGLQQLTGVTVPFGVPRSLAGVEASRLQPADGYSVESEARRRMDEQRRIKDTWAQFLNIFDMSLDLANDVSKDRQEAKQRRKERLRLEKQQRLEEARKERQERCCEAQQRAQDTAQKKQEKEGSNENKQQEKEDIKEKRKESKENEEEKTKEKEQPKAETERKPEPEPEPETEATEDQEPPQGPPDEEQGITEEPTPEGA